MSALIVWLEREPGNREARIVDLERPCFHTVLVTRSRPMNISTLQPANTVCPCKHAFRVSLFRCETPPLIPRYPLGRQNDTVIHGGSSDCTRIDFTRVGHFSCFEAGSHLELLSQLLSNGFCYNLTSQSSEKATCRVKASRKNSISAWPIGFLSSSRTH